MFWNKKQPQEPKATIEACAHALYEALAKGLTKNGRIHVEDLISAAAAIVGEASIDAAGDFNPLSHEFAPGGRVFSTNANVLISGDKDFDEAPADSIVGILKEKLTNCGFTKADFPILKDVFTYFAANVGKKEDWGKVPLSVSKDHHPFILPLRAAYEIRPTVDKCFAPLGNNRQQKLQAATLTLAETLCKTRDVLDRRIAITLALETVNGMAKTAPMTDAAMAKLKTG
jgi:hypothetical protein